MNRFLEATLRLKPGRLTVSLILLCGALLILSSPFHSMRPTVTLGLSAAALIGLNRLGSVIKVRKKTTARANERNGDSLLVERTMEAVEAELHDSQESMKQLRETYRGVAKLHREQKTQITLLQVSARILESAAVAAPDSRGYTALLNQVMEFMECSGGVVWRRVPNSETLIAETTDGRISPPAHFAPLNTVAGLPVTEIRLRCEMQMADALPVPALQLRLPLTTEDSEEQTVAKTRGAQKTLILVLRAEPEDGNPGEVLGAIGLCDPYGVVRFNANDTERLQSLTAALTKAYQSLEIRRAMQRSLNEVTLLYDLSRLMESASDIEQIYKAVVAQVMKILPCENCTLFLLDRTNKKLEARATKGRTVNLLEHFAFEKGQGVSGWVASRGKQIVIDDLDHAPNLLNVENLPTRVRSFVATPMRVQNTVIGVLHVSHSLPNAFSPDDIHLLSIIAGQAAVTIERTTEYHNLETLAVTDGLTRTYNHRYFQMRLEDELRRCKRYRLPLSLLIIDADHFKAINDEFGHASGDAVLRDMGMLLRQCSRDTEIVARWGGEEFGVLLPQTDAEHACIAAERLRTCVESHDFRAVDGQPIRVTISIGVAGYPPDGTTRAEIVEQADRALYAAKRNGRNQVGVLEPPVHALVAVNAGTNSGNNPHSNGTSTQVSA